MPVTTPLYPEKPGFPGFPGKSAVSPEKNAPSGHPGSSTHPGKTGVRAEVAARLAEAAACGVRLWATTDGRLRWRCADGLPDDLKVKLLALRAAVLEALAFPHGRCACGRPLDRKGACWRCGARPCTDCGRNTGSPFIARCVPCGERFNGNRGGWTEEGRGARSDE